MAKKRTLLSRIRVGVASSYSHPFELKSRDFLKTFEVDCDCLKIELNDVYLVHTTIIMKYSSSLHAHFGTRAYIFILPKRLCCGPPKTGVRKWKIRAFSVLVFFLFNNCTENKEYQVLRIYIGIYTYENKLTKTVERGSGRWEQSTWKLFNDTYSTFCVTLFSRRDCEIFASSWRWLPRVCTCAPSSARKVQLSQFRARLVENYEKAECINLTFDSLINLSVEVNYSSLFAQGHLTAVLAQRWRLNCDESVIFE